MNSRQTVKIIKSTQRVSKTQGPRKPQPSVRKNDRDIASNVAEWIREFQQNRHTESGRTFASLFAEPMSPLEHLS
jgi:hypothetical protein